MDDEELYFKNSDGQILSAEYRISVSYSGLQSAKNITLQLELPDYITVDKNPIIINEISSGGTPYIDTLLFYGLLGFDPGSMNMKLNASYFN